MQIVMLEVYCGVLLNCVQCFVYHLCHNKAFEKEKKTSVGELKMLNEAEGEDGLQWRDRGNSPLPLGALEQRFPVQRSHP